MTACNSHLDRSQLVQLVRRWAEVNTDGILDQATLYFSVPHIEGVIGYRIELGHAVVMGDPICAPQDQVAFAEEFEKYCQSKKLRVIYIIVSEPFAHLAAEKLSFSAVEFGKKFVLDPLIQSNNRSALLRKKLRQSTRNGVDICEYLEHDPAIEQEMEQVAIDWVQARKGVQIYLAQPTLFDDRLGKRWFYAKREGKIIGFVLLNELQSHQGWLLNNVMVVKGSPSGVSEHLVVSAIEALEKEQCRFVLIGPVPSQELGKMIGFGQTIAKLIGWFYKSIKRISHLGGHEVFWDKFQPGLKSAYLLFPKKRFRISSVLALLKALNLSFR